MFDQISIQYLWHQGMVIHCSQVEAGMLVESDKRFESSEERTREGSDGTVLFVLANYYYRKRNAAPLVIGISSSCLLEKFLWWI